MYGHAKNILSEITFFLYRKERAEFEKKRTEEIAKWEEFKKEEHKKLQRERKLFEKHAATVRARPDKQERDEIQVQIYYCRLEKYHLNLSCAYN